MTRKDIVVVGGLALDTACDVDPADDRFAHSSPANAADALDKMLYTSNPSKMADTVGGVGYNISDAVRRQSNAWRESVAESGEISKLAAAREAPTVQLVSTVGNDRSGRAVLRALRHSGINRQGIPKKDTLPTARYVALNGPDSNLLFSAADMHIIENLNIDDVRQQVMTPGAEVKVLCVDGNLNENLYGDIWSLGREIGATTVFEPTSVAKSTRILSAPGACETCFPYHNIDFSTPNSYELMAMSDFIGAVIPTIQNPQVSELGSLLWSVTVEDSFVNALQQLQESASYVSQQPPDFQGLVNSAASVLPFIPTIFTKLGAKGVFLARIIPAPPAPPPGDDFATRSDYTAHYDAERLCVTSAPFELPASLVAQLHEPETAQPEPEATEVESAETRTSQSADDEILNHISPSDFAATNTSDGTHTSPSTSSIPFALQVQYFPPLPVEPTRIVTVNGAGDTFLASILVNIVRYRHERGLDLSVWESNWMDELVNTAQEAAVERLYTDVPRVDVKVKEKKGNNKVYKARTPTKGDGVSREVTRAVDAHEGLVRKIPSWDPKQMALGRDIGIKGW